MRIILVSFLAVMMSVSVAQSIAGDWPRWRGPDRNSISTETGLMSSWSPVPPKQAWHTSGMGDGYSSVVVANKLVYTMGRIGKDVVCTSLDLESGRKRWATKIGTTSRNVMSTPTVHDNLVYALDPDGELVCLNAATGKILWSKSFTKDFGGRLMSSRGYGESVLIDGDRLICTPGGEKAMLVALDRRSGELIWKASIPAIGEKGRDGAAFSSIVISKGAGVRQYVQLTGRGLIGIEADSGRYLWGYNDISNTTANIPTPVVHGDLVFSANGYNAGSVLIKLEPTKEGTGVAAKEVYCLRGSRFQNHHGGFVLIGNYIFGGHGSNNGLPTCVELKTGRIVWKSRGPGTGSASVVAADGHLYFRYQNGVMALIEANPASYQSKGSFKIPGAGGDSWSHPMISHGKLFLREKDDLWVYHLRQSNSETQSDAAQIKLPPKLAALKRLGAVVVHLNPDQMGNQYNPLFRFAQNSTQNQNKLSYVKLNDRHITDEGMIKAKLLSMLQQLDGPFILSLSGTNIDEGALQQVSGLKSLVGLNLALCRRLKDNHFKPLAVAKQLVVLIATGTSISEQGLQEITRIPNLQALDLEICNQVTDSACEILGEMQQLRGLNLKKTAFEKKRISNLGLSKLTGLVKLEFLDVSGNNITNDGLQSLKPLAHLRELRLNRVPINDEGLTKLTTLKHLEYLELIFTEGFAGPKVTDAGTKPLSELKQLKTLNMVGARITDESLPHLSSLKKLTHLIVIGSNFSNIGMNQLQQELPDCKVVFVRR